jgi:hypothetical protein
MEGDEVANQTVLPASVITEDRRLDGTAAKAQEVLARLRWHWTLDESNPKRVSFRDYAAAVGRDQKTIRMWATAWDRTNVAGDVPRTRSLTDEFELAGLGERRRVAAEAIADATGMTASNIVAHHRDKIRETISAAEDAADRRGTSVDEEIPRVAQSHQRTREVAARGRSDRKARSSLRFIEMEGDFAAAKRRLVHALEVAKDVGFDDEELTMLRNTIAQLTALLNLIDMRLGGMPNVDWDAEAAKLLDGVA